MKLKVIIALTLALVLLTGCAETASPTRTADETPTGETVTEQENTETEQAEEADVSEVQPPEIISGDTAEADTDAPAQVDAEIQREPNADDPGVDRGVWEYTVTKDENGDILYDFIDFVLVLPADWEGKYNMENYEDENGSTISFYHTASEELHMANYNLKGGRLMWVGYCLNDDYKQLPDYRVIGSDVYGGTYYLGFPSDVQAYTEDEAVLNEFTALSSEYAYIVENTHMIEAIG